MRFPWRSAGRELMLPPSLTRRLVNHAGPNGVTQGYADDWTIARLAEVNQEHGHLQRDTLRRFQFARSALSTSPSP